MFYIFILLSEFSRIIENENGERLWQFSLLHIMIFNLNLVHSIGSSGAAILEKTIFNIPTFNTFSIIPSWSWDMVLYLIKILKPLSPKDAFCQTWLKLNGLFNGFRVSKTTDSLTDWQNMKSNWKVSFDLGFNSWTWQKKERILMLLMNDWRNKSREVTKDIYKAWCDEMHDDDTTSDLGSKVV